jgi:hypothetical protein
MKHLYKYIVPIATFLPLAASAQLVNPLGENDPRAVIANVINVVLGILGAISLLVFIYAGVSLMISGGVPEKVKKARNTLVWAIVGLALIFSSYGILNFIFQALTGE